MYFLCTLVGLVNGIPETTYYGPEVGIVIADAGQSCICAGHGILSKFWLKVKVAR